MCDVAMVQGNNALALVERFGDRSLRTRPCHLVYGSVHHWNMPVRDMLDNELSVYYSGIETGDIEYGCWGAHMYCGALFYAGVELPKVARELATYSARMTHYQQLAQLNVTVQFTQITKNLMGQAEDPTRLVGPGFDDLEGALEAVELSAE